MIKARFFSKSGRFFGFKVSGHANYGKQGQDIICASVSTASILAANTIATIHKSPAFIKNKGSNIELLLFKNNEASSMLIEGLYVFLKELSTQYPKHLIVTTTERSYNHD